ncbi:hypothetical protein CKQ90_29875, partial [Klebsiella pneumoniae]
MLDGLLYHESDLRIEEHYTDTAGFTDHVFALIAPARLPLRAAQFYTHISDQYAPFSTRVVNVGVRDSTYVLDGLLYHESDLRIEEHYTDTAGFTDHVFAL